MPTLSLAAGRRIFLDLTSIQVEEKRPWKYWSRASRTHLWQDNVTPSLATMSTSHRLALTQRNRQAERQTCNSTDKNTWQWQHLAFASIMKVC